MKQHIVTFLTELKSRKDSLGESLANKKASTSLEDTFADVLTAAGVQDLSDDWRRLKDGESGYFDSSNTKSYRKNLFKQLKAYVNDIGSWKSLDLREDTDKLFPKDCFIRHPNGPNGHIDFLIILNNKMLYWEIKTGGGKSGKMNDRLIPAQFFVLMSSRHTDLNCPYTFFQTGDIMTDQAYNFYEGAVEIFSQMKKQLKSLPGRDQDSVKQYIGSIGARLIVGWGKANDDWYDDPIKGLTSTQREAKVLDMLRAI